MSEKKKGDELLDRSDVFEEIQLPKLDCNRRGSRIIEDEHGSFQSYSSGERESNVVPVTSTDNLKGIIIMVISCCCFGAMGFFMKLSYNHNSSLTEADVMIVRTVIMLPCYYGIAKYLGVNLIDISFKNFGILTFRCISGGFAVFLLFMSIRLLPASIAFMISNLNPLLATLFACVILKEPQKIVNIVCAIGSFAGVIIIGVGRRNETSNGHFQIFAILVCLLSALLGSLAIVSMRKLNQYVHYIFSPYYLCISCMVIAISFAVVDSDYFNIDKCDIIDISLVTCTGIAGLLGQLLLSLAFKYSHASSAAPLLYINCLFNVFTDTLYFKLRFFYTDIIGALVITFCVFFPVFLMCRQHYQK